MFVYCGNNPASRKDENGEAFETVFDVISLGFSIADVAQNPKSFWAWAGLAGDIIDVVVPFVGGLGESARALNTARKAADKIDDIHDAGKATQKVSKSMRSSAVRKAWQNEYEQVLQTGSGSRQWTEEQIAELLQTGRVKGYEGHHMRSVKGYPELAGDPTNIQFLTPKEHLAAHGGNWRNITHGRYEF